MSTDNATKTYSETDYNAAVERARNFEAKLTDLEKKMSQYKDIDPEAHKAIREELNILKAEKASIYGFTVILEKDADVIM